MTSNASVISDVTILTVAVTVALTTSVMQWVANFFDSPGIRDRNKINMGAEPQSGSPMYAGTQSDELGGSPMNVNNRALRDKPGADVDRSSINKSTSSVDHPAQMSNNNSADDGRSVRRERGDLATDVRSLFQCLGSLGLLGFLLTSACYVIISHGCLVVAAFKYSLYAQIFAVLFQCLFRFIFNWMRYFLQRVKWTCVYLLVDWIIESLFHALLSVAVFRITESLVHALLSVEVDWALRLIAWEEIKTWCLLVVIVFSCWPLLRLLRRSSSGRGCAKPSYFVDSLKFGSNPVSSFRWTGIFDFSNPPFCLRIGGCGPARPFDPGVRGRPFDPGVCPALLDTTSSSSVMADVFHRSQSLISGRWRRRWRDAIAALCMQLGGWFLVLIMSRLEYVPYASQPSVSCDFTQPPTSPTACLAGGDLQYSLHLLDASPTSPTACLAGGDLQYSLHLLDASPTSPIACLAGNSLQFSLLDASSTLDTYGFTNYEFDAVSSIQKESVGVNPFGASSIQEETACLVQLDSAFWFQKETVSSIQHRVPTALELAAFACCITAVYSSWSYIGLLCCLRYFGAYLHHSALRCLAIYEAFVYSLRYSLSQEFGYTNLICYLGLPLEFGNSISIWLTLGLLSVSSSIGLRSRLFQLLSGFILRWRRRMDIMSKTRCMMRHDSSVTFGYPLNESSLFGASGHLVIGGDGLRERERALSTPIFRFGFGCWLFIHRRFMLVQLLSGTILRWRRRMESAGVVCYLMLLDRSDTDVGHFLSGSKICQSGVLAAAEPHPSVIRQKESCACQFSIKWRYSHVWILYIICWWTSMLLQIPTLRGVTSLLFSSTAISVPILPGFISTLLSSEVLSSVFSTLPFLGTIYSAFIIKEVSSLVFGASVLGLILLETVFSFEYLRNMYFQRDVWIACWRHRLHQSTYIPSLLHVGHFFFQKEICTHLVRLQSLFQKEIRSGLDGLSRALATVYTAVIATASVFEFVHLFATRRLILFKFATVDPVDRLGNIFTKGLTQASSFVHPCRCCSAGKTLQLTHSRRSVNLCEMSRTCLSRDKETSRIKRLTHIWLWMLVIDRHLILVQLLSRVIPRWRRRRMESILNMLCWWTSVLLRMPTLLGPSSPVLTTLSTVFIELKLREIPSIAFSASILPGFISLLGSGIVSTLPILLGTVTLLISSITSTLPLLLGTSISSAFFIGHTPLKICSFVYLRNLLFKSVDWIFTMQHQQYADILSLLHHHFGRSSFQKEIFSDSVRHLCLLATSLAAILTIASIFGFVCLRTALRPMDDMFYGLEHRALFRCISSFGFACHVGRWTYLCSCLWEPPCTAWRYLYYQFTASKSIGITSFLRDIFASLSRIPPKGVARLAIGTTRRNEKECRCAMTSQIFGIPPLRAVERINTCKLPHPLAMSSLLRLTQ